MKSVRIRSFSGPYFPAFRLNTERYPYLSVFSLNAGKYGPQKLRIQTFFTQWCSENVFHHLTITILNKCKSLIFPSVKGKGSKNKKQIHSPNVKLFKKTSKRIVKVKIFETKNIKKLEEERNPKLEQGY